MKSSHLKSLLALACIILLAAASAFAADPLQAGVGVSNITPDTTKFHVPLGGYGDRNNAPALGVHDNAMCKALILKQGNKKIAFITSDLLGIPRSLRDEVLKRIADTGITSDTLMLTASHCHASQEMNAMNRNNVFENKKIGIFDESLLTFTADEIAAAIHDADKSFQPVRAGADSMHLPGMNRNRRNGPIVDDELTVLRIDTMDGKPLVALVNWTAHPTFMNEHIMYVCADWPGYLQREIEAFVPGITCMYTNGAEGDIAPNGGQGPSEYARAEDYGRKIAVKALGLYPTIKTEENAPLDFAMHELKLPERTVPPALRDAAGPEYDLIPENVDKLVDVMSPKSSYLGVVRIGDFVGISIPGELVSELGLQVKKAVADSGAKHPVILGLANEWISYMLQPAEYHKGGYEPGVSFYGDQLGPVVVKQAIDAGTTIMKQNATPKK